MRRVQRMIAGSLGALVLVVGLSSSRAAVPDTPDGALASPRVSTGSAGPVADVAISGSGRYVVFDSNATNLYSAQAGEEPTPQCEVFRRDLLTDTTILVSRATGATGNVGNGCSTHPAIDYDGNEIAFLTTAPNLGATGGTQVAVVRDVSAGTDTVASVANGAGGAPAGDGVTAVAISGDGTQVAFTSSQDLDSPTVSGTGGVQQVWLRDLAAQTTTLVSNADGSAVAPSPAPAGAPSVDEYGTAVAFTTTASLTSAPASGVGQVYVRTLGSGSTVLASAASGSSGAPAGAPATDPSLDADGNAVAFLSSATNLGDPTGQTDAYVRSLTAATTVIANTVADGATLSNAPAGPPSLSAYGNVVAFASAATNLGADPQGHVQVWVHDLARGLVTLASPAAGGSLGANGDSTAPSLAEGGIAVAYVSAATNLDPAGADTDTVLGAYVRRVRVAQTVPANSTVLITRDGLDGRSSGNQPVAESGQAIEYAVSGNGRYVAFELTAPLTGEVDGPAETQRYGVYVRDLETGEIELVNRASDADGVPGSVLAGCGNDYDGYVAISQDGRYVAFDADDPATGNCEVYLRDRQAGTTTLESVQSATSGGLVADADSFNPGLSSNGTYLVFASQADNLTPHHPAADEAPYWDLYERDLQTGTTTIVSLPDDQAPGGTVFSTGPSGYYDRPSVTNDGRYVVFDSEDSQLETGSTLNPGRLTSYVRDMQTDRTLVLQQHGSSFGDASSTSYHAEISPDGSVVVFDSNSTGLVPGHSSYVEDVYYRALSFDPGTGDLDSTIHIASVPTGPEPSVGGTFGNALAEYPVISDDGIITFLSEASNYGGTPVSGGVEQVWQRNTFTNTTTLISRASGLSGVASNGYTVVPPDASADGSVVAFSSTGTNLNPDGSSYPLGYVRIQSALAVNGTPQIEGDLHDGSTVTCAPGVWGGSPAFTYAWLRGSAQTPIAAATSSTYTITDADVDGPLACQVTASNGDGSQTSAAVTPLPDAPVNTAAPALSGGTAAGDQLTCGNGSWTATPARDAPSTFTYQWLFDGSAISGSSQSTFTITPSDLGHNLGCQVTATNAGGSTSALSNTIGPPPPAPVNSAPPHLSFTAPAFNGTLLTCEPGSWPADATVTVSWDRNGLTIPGATGRTYLIAVGDVHTTINCTETATNAGGTAAADSSNTSGVIRRKAPVAISPPVPTFDGNGTVTCEPAKFDYTAPDTFAWFRDGAPITTGLSAGSTGPGQVYALGVADLGHSLSCQETETNSDGYQTTADSGSLPVQNTVCELIAARAGSFTATQATTALSDGPGSAPLAYAAGNSGGVVIPLPPQPNCSGFDPQDVTAGSAPGTYAAVAPGGTLKTKIQCPVKVLTGCAGEAVLVIGRIPTSKVAGITRAVKPAVVSRVRISVIPGHTATIHLRLSASARRAIRGGRKLVCTLVFKTADAPAEAIAYLVVRS